MAVQIKGQMFFVQEQGKRECGWEESIYLTEDQPLDKALLTLQDLAKKRVDLLGVGVELEYMRVSRIVDAAGLPVLLDSQVASGIVPHIVTDVDVTQYNMIPGAAGQPSYNRRLFNMTSAGDKAAPIADFSSSGYLCRVEGIIEGGTNNFQSRRPYVLRGNPDGAQTILSDGPLGNDWTRAFTAWVTAMKNGKYGFQALDKVNNPLKKITAISNAAKPVLTINAHGYSIGDELRVFGVTMRPSTDVPPVVGVPPKGIYLVENVVDANNIVLAGYKGPASPLLKTGYAQKRTRGIAKISNVFGRRWTSRRVSTPFDAVQSRHRKKSA